MSEDLITESDRNTATKLRDKKILDGLIVICGFGLCRSWIVYCLAAPLGQATPNIAHWVYLVLGALAALAVACSIRRSVRSIETIRQVLFWITTASLGLSALFIILSLVLLSGILLMSGFIIGGIGAGILQVLWGERFAFFEIRFAIIVTPAATVVTALLLSVTSFNMVSLGYIAFPLLSLTLLVAIFTRTDIKIPTPFIGLYRAGSGSEADLAGAESGSEADLAGGAEPEALKPKALLPGIEAGGSTESVKRTLQKPLIRSVNKLMFSIMVFAFLCRTFDAVPINGLDPFAFFGGSALLALVIVAVVILLLAALLKDRFNPTITYRLSLPIMVAGFVVITLFVDTQVAFSILLINIGYGFFDIMSWILFTEISRRKGMLPLRIFGFGVTFMFIGMALGLMCGELLQVFIQSGSVQITVIALLSILSLVVVAFLVIPEGTIMHLAFAFSQDKKDGAKQPLGETDIFDTAEGDETGQQQEVRRIEERCVIVAEKYRLTPREGEVLVLLAYGRTLSIIARDLFIAKGTARTHIENIYRKLDVHKQQELIDLVEDCGL